MSNNFLSKFLLKTKLGPKACTKIEQNIPPIAKAANKSPAIGLSTNERTINLKT